MKIIRVDNVVTFGELIPGDVFAEVDSPSYVYIKIETCERKSPEDGRLYQGNCVELASGDINYFNDYVEVERMNGAFVENAEEGGKS